MHDVGCAERVRLDSLGVGDLVGDENDLAVFRLTVEPSFKFEQVRAISEIDVEQQTWLRFSSVNVIEIEKRQFKNAAELLADGLPLHCCVAENAKLVHHGSPQACKSLFITAPTSLQRTVEYNCLCLNKIVCNF